jgi:hypothetical protein
MKAIAIILVVLGVCMLMWTGFNYTKKEKIIDAGPLEISADKQERINWPPYLGAVLIAGGIAVFAVTRKSS